MREDASLEEILQELAVKFTEAKNFFGTSTMALSMEGREVTEVEEIRILDTIRKNSNVRIACIVGHDETTNKNFIKALQHMEKKLSTRSDISRIFRRSFATWQELFLRKKCFIFIPSPSYAFRKIPVTFVQKDTPFSKSRNGISFPSTRSTTLR
jgi:hypothetical protein